MQPEDLANRFTYHPPAPGSVPAFEAIRHGGHQLAAMIDSLVPECREKTLAVTKIEEAVMWANAGIARNQEATTGGGPHSRACGIHPHDHGFACSRDCPTCGGRL